MRVHEILVKNDLSLDTLKTISHKAALFQSNIYVYLYEESIQIDVKSLLGLILQIIHKGTTITIKTIGNDDLEALEEMCSLFENA